MDEFKIPTAKKPILAEKKSLEVKNADPPKESSESKEPISQQPQLECPYKVPVWSNIPSSTDSKYKFEVLKSGQIIEEVADLQNKATWKFGRLPENDIVLAHPTISRFHAILQYRPGSEKTDEDDEKQKPVEGWYVYDLESTHGTFLNKQRIPSCVYIRIQVGHMLRLGASTRSYILQGPTDDEEPESELTVTELREQRLQQQQTAEEMKRKAAAEAEEKLRNEGIDWGMGEDADEETDLSHNPYAITNNEDLFLDDPKKTLRGYFEREDIPLEYKCDEMSTGCFVCRVELPIDDANGRPIIAEVVHKGRKKECVLQCALEACRILDRHGVLRQANQEPLKRKNFKPKDSDSDDDEFWDRTGDVERRKQRKANTNTNVTLTYDDLVKQEIETAAQLQKVEADIAEYQLKLKREKEQKDAQNDADLDSFMEHLSEDISTLDKTEIKRLRLEEQRLKSEHLKLQRLMKIAKPYELRFSNDNRQTMDVKTNLSKKQLPMIGKRNQFSKFKVAKPQTIITKSSKTYASDEEELEDDDDPKIDEEMNEKIKSTKIETKPTAPSINKVESPKGEENIQRKDEEVCEGIKTKVPSPTPKDDEKEIVSEPSEEIINNSVDSKSHTEITAQKVVADSNEAKCRSDETQSSAKKRHRQRPRQHSKRHDVDIEELDEHESSEKYAKWLPPPNQTGDGFTALNEKYGY